MTQKKNSRKKISTNTMTKLRAVILQFQQKVVKSGKRALSYFRRL